MTAAISGTFVFIILQFKEVETHRPSFFYSLWSAHTSLTNSCLHLHATLDAKL